MGLSVVSRPSLARGEPDRRLELQRLARQERAFCALRILRAKGGPRSAVDLSLTDRLTNKTLWRTIRVNQSAPGAASLVALRVVELLRASLLELTVRRRQRARVVPAVVQRLARLPGRRFPRVTTAPRRPRPWALRSGLGVTGGPGGVGAHGQIELAVRWSPLSHFALEVTSTVTAIGIDLAERGLQASADLGTATAWALWEIRSRGRLRPALGLGVGVLWLWSTGRASPQVRTRTDVAAAATIAARAELGLVLTPWLWLRLSVAAGVALPEIEIHFLGERVARLGLPVITGQLGLEIRL